MLWDLILPTKSHRLIGAARRLRTLRLQRPPLLTDSRVMELESERLVKELIARILRECRNNST
jgi:hypothetical protein